MSDKVLSEELKKQRERHFELRSQTVTEKVSDTSQFSKARHDIARVQTELSARRHKAAGTTTAKAAPAPAAAAAPAKAAKTKTVSKTSGKTAGKTAKAGK